MKKLYFLLFALMLFKGVSAQTIVFADQKFKTKLLQASTSNTIAKNLSGNYFKIDSNNNGQIEVNEALQVSHLNINNLYTPAVDQITNVGELSYFTNLTFLNCGNNMLYNLNVSALTNLVTLDCRFNLLSSLDLSGLVNITSLECRNNRIVTLNLTGLSNVQSIIALNNQITSIDLTGLNSLTTLNLLSNQLTQLNCQGLLNLTTLSCGGNQINNLNVAPALNLQDLYCSGNRLTTLNIQSLVNLVNLDCANNLLTAIDIQGLNQLYNFSCNNNRLTTLDAHGLPLLKFLYCSSNLLTSINISSLPSLEYLHCDNNQLVDLNLTSQPFLSNLICSNNLLTTLSFEYLPRLSLFRCFSNRLESLIVKNGVTNGFSQNFSDFHDNPNLAYICADELEMESVERLLVQFNFSDVEVNYYCNNVSYDKNTLTGAVRFYSNPFNITGPGAIVNNLRVYETMKASSITPNTAGNYSFYFVPGVNSGWAYLRFENPDLFYGPQESYNFIYQNGGETVVKNFNFWPASNNLNKVDFEVVLVPLNNAQPGENAKYDLLIKNKGNAVSAGTVNLTFNDDVLDFVSASPVLQSQATNTLSWSFTDLKPFESRALNLTLRVNSVTDTPSVSEGFALDYTATIALSSGTDYYPADNSFAYRQTVVNSFDSNDKTCLQGNSIAPSEAGKYVHYLIRFENRGTSNVQNVVVKDMIDTSKFDIYSLTPIKGSHDYVMSIVGNRVEFLFENINLPFDDANNDGYIAFKVKTLSSLTANDSFTNKASIIFDYGTPIVTNVARTFMGVLNTQDFNFENYFALYPNPVNNELNIEIKQTIEVSSISIYNQLGQLVLVVPNAQDVNKVDVSSLSAGNYFIKINSDKGTSNTKFIKK
ncbi:T9SS type A sorting domain-containing protein [Flavobacterium sp. SM15]|uniref:T9SS type A sorting domain-containing protein n=1 Tax=Flavobacterium sp. SM15 TaxID=2908005 RepID=UPI001EDBE373|nr:T9SS type A sorting domain-containing protein [Flavobacterium sp. SM15]MCG2611425.1 T9SS type A sorting domain-containing protein [Flavobacterium sp. SM15]